MSLFPLEGPEVECVKKLAEVYRSGEQHWDQKSGWASIGLTEENHAQVLGVLEVAGVISNPSHTFNGRFRSFLITPVVIQYARHIAETEAKNREKKDVVEDIKYTAQRHPIIAWGLVLFAVFMALLTAAAQGTTLLKNVGVLK